MVFFRAGCAGLRASAREGSARLLSMSDKTGGKKRGGRRAYLNDFRVGADGEYSYRGKVRVYSGQLPYKQVKLRVGAAAGVMAAATIAAGVIPASAMLGFGNWYVIPFFIISLIAVFLTVWCVVRLVSNGQSLREYIHKAAVKPLPGRSAFAAIASLCSFAANVVYLCINGFGKAVWAGALLPVLHIITAGAAYYAHRTASALTWDTVFEDTEESGFAAALELEQGDKAENK